MTLLFKNTLIRLLLFFIIVVFSLPFIGIILEGFDLSNWSYVLKSTKTLTAIKNSSLIAIIAVLINIILGTPVASYIGQNNFKGKKIIEFIILLPLIIPAFITTMGIQFFFIQLGLIETFLGVGIVHSLVTFPYYIRSLSSGYSTLNKDYEKMGRILGANSLNIFFKINLPFLLPTFITAISLVIIVSFAQYLVTLIIGGGEIITIPILMFPFISGGDFKVGAVYSIVYIIINMSFILFIEKSIKKFLYINKEENSHDKN